MESEFWTIVFALCVFMSLAKAIDCAIDMSNYDKRCLENTINWGMLYFFLGMAAIFAFCAVMSYMNLSVKQLI